jgi:hypothetical protein
VRRCARDEVRKKPKTKAQGARHEREELEHEDKAAHPPHVSFHHRGGNWLLPVMVLFVVLAVLGIHVWLPAATMTIAFIDYVLP